MPEPLIIRVANHTRITIYDDASMSVKRGDCIITLPPEEARRIVATWVFIAGKTFEGMDDILAELGLK